MSEGLNRVLLLGNLGADPELRFTQAGQAVLNLRLATTESYLDKDKVRRERTDWHAIVVWGKRGEALAKILTKGSSVFIEGSIRTSSYDNKEGQKVYKTEIVANNVILSGRGRGGGGDEAGDQEHDGGDQAPADGGRGGGYNRGGGGGSASSAGDFEVAFGRDKGKRISEVSDLSWLRGALERDLADDSKSRFHEKARGQIAAIDAELARRAGGAGGGGGYNRGRPAGQPAAAPPPGAAAPPSDDYAGDYGGGDGGDDEIPF